MTLSHMFLDAVLVVVAVAAARVGTDSPRVTLEFRGCPLWHMSQIGLPVDCYGFKSLRWNLLRSSRGRG